MDTPANNHKKPRRKLKKILKKTKPSFNTSSHSLYQRRVKSAINVSLNSTRNVRTLQANNRSLASNLETMRQHFRQLHDQYTHLLEKNHGLRERILELERVVDSTSFIEEEVNRRVEDHMEVMRTKLRPVKEHTLGLLEALTELSDLCASQNTSESTDLATQPKYRASPLSPPPVLPSFRFLQNDDEEAGDFNEDTELESDGAGLMSLIMEQSILNALEETGSSAASQLEAVTESDTALTVNRRRSHPRLPARILVQNKEPKEPDQAEEFMTAVSKFNVKMNMETGKKMLRRETFTLPLGQPADDELITNESPPQCLVSESINDEIDDRTLDKDTGSTQETKEHTVNTTTMHSSVKEKKSNIPLSLKKAPPAKQIRQPSKKDKGPVAPAGKKEQDLFISNEFDLINTHLKLKEKTENKTTAEDINKADQILSSVGCGGEHTILVDEDMELTVGLDAGCFSKDTGVVAGLGTGDNSERIVSAKSPPADEKSNNVQLQTRTRSRSRLKQQTRTRSRSRSKQGATKPTDDAIDPADEIIPDAVTLRQTKPGQLSFAASRKESDGTRKLVPNLAPKARSKSKKEIAEMIDNLPQTEPKCIFDFHDKTPSSLSGDKQKAISVFSISADESTLSPPLSLSAARARSKTTGSRQSAAISPHMASPSEKQQKTKKQHTLLGDGVTYTAPLKGSPMESGEKSKSFRVRSQSSGRRKQKEDDKDTKTKRAQSQGRKKESRKSSRSPIKSPLSRSRGRSLRRKRLSPAGGQGNSPGKVGDGNESEPLQKDKCSNESMDMAYKDTSEIDSNQRDSQGIKCSTQSHMKSNSSDHQERSLSRSSKKYKQKESEEVLSNTDIPSNKSPTSITTRKSQRTNDKSSHSKTISSGSQHSEMSEVTSNVKMSKDISKSLNEDGTHLHHNVAVSSLENAGQDTQSIPQTANSHSSGFVENKNTTVISTSFVQNDTSPNRVTADSTESAAPTGLEETVVKSRSRSRVSRKKVSSRSTDVLPEIENPPKKNEDLQSEAITKNEVEIEKVNGGDSLKEKEKKRNQSAGKSQRKSKKSKPVKETESSEDKSEPKMQEHQAKETEAHDMQDKFEEESSLLLQKVKLLKTPAMKGREDDTNNKTPGEEEKSKLAYNVPGPRISRIVKKSSGNVSPEKKNETSPQKETGASPQKKTRTTPGSSRKRSASPEASAKSPGMEGKRRRAATKVNYAELPLNLKMRRGDPFTSHYCSTDKLDIFKSPRQKAKKKAELRRNILGPLHNLAIREEKA